VGCSRRTREQHPEAAPGYYRVGVPSYGTVESMTKLPDSREYERLVESLVEQLAQRAGVHTEQITRDVQVPGRGTVNQIDVLWDFVDARGQPRRVVFEARSYRRRVDQGKLHAFRSVVDDIQAADRAVQGVMVTTTGYQSGAKDIASTYGLVVLELRAPTDDDFAGRLGKVVLTITAQAPIIEDVKFEAVEVYDDDFATTLVEPAAISIEPAEGRPDYGPLDEFLCRDELGPPGQPRMVHEIRREFNPPAVLLVHGVRTALVRAVTARVGEVAVPPVTVTIAGAKTIAWLLRDSLAGSRAWIADNGRVWMTGS
jgi:hypothetical protein